MDKEKIFGFAQELRIKLNDSIIAGRNPIEIILEIAKLLGELSGEETYYQEIKNQIFAIYGLVLNNEFVLEREIKEVSERLNKISKAYESPDFSEEEKIRIKSSLERHKLELKRLRGMIINVFQ